MFIAGEPPLDSQLFPPDGFSLGQLAFAFQGASEVGERYFHSTVGFAVNPPSRRQLLSIKGGGLRVFALRP